MNTTYISRRRVKLSDGSDAYDLVLVQGENTIQLAINSENNSIEVMREIVGILKRSMNDDIVDRDGILLPTAKRMA